MVDGLDEFYKGTVQSLKWEQEGARKVLEDPSPFKRMV